MGPQDADDNWIVADSEDEDTLLLVQPEPIPPAGQLEGSGSGPSISISTIDQFPSRTEALHRPVDTSAISTFSTNPRLATASTISSFPAPSEPPAASTSSSRPRPRPVIKRAQASSEVSRSDSPTIQTPSPDKAILPTTIAGPSFQRSLHTPLKDNALSVDYPQGAAERAKMRARKAVKAITPQVDVIDISSDEDELVLKSPEPRKTNKARPKPRPVKRAKVADPHPADVSITESEATIPVPSSSFPMVPPSDPLPSSSAPRPSSPRSLIRDSPVPESSSLSSTSSSKKRKRSSRIVDESDNEGDGVGAVDRDSALMPPPAVPPLFFADSSGSVEVPEASAPPSKKSKKGEKKAKKAGEEGAKKPKAKPGKRKQKSTVQVVIEPSSPSSTDKTRDNDVVMEDCGTSAPTMQPAARRPSPMDFRGSLSPVPNSEDEDELQLIPPSAARKQPPAPKEVAQKSKSNKGKATNNNDGIGDGVKKSRKKVAKKAVIPDDDEGEAAGEDVVSTTVSDGKGKSKDHTPIGETDGEAESEIPSRTKENVQPSSPRPDPKPSTPTPSTPAPSSTSTTRRWTFGRPKATPMQEIIRRAASHAGSPVSVGTYSPLAKSSKSMLRRIAPLHPNRSTPPPPAPRPPPPKKSKKMLDLEEKWELELQDEVEGWYALTDEERAQWRRAKRDKELGYED